MPVYEYECGTCGKVTEALRPMVQADDELPCESCGSEKTHRAQSVFSAKGADGQPGFDLPPSCGTCGGPPGSCAM